MTALMFVLAIAMRPAGFEVLAELPAGCELRAAGPIGGSRIWIVPAYPVGEARWLVRPPVAGRWLFAAVCGCIEILLEPPVMEVLPARRYTSLMRLRKVKPEDAASVAELCGQLGYPATVEQTKARLDAIGGRPDHRLIGAELEGKLIGWAHVHADWALDHGFEAHLLGLVVHEEQRGLGIGRALIGEAAEWAFKHHCTRLRVRTNVIRLRAGDFYRRAGFREVKRQLVLDLPLAGA